MSEYFIRRKFLIDSHYVDYGTVQDFLRVADNVQRGWDKEKESVDRLQQDIMALKEALNEAIQLYANDVADYEHENDIEFGEANLMRLRNAART